jgi:diguanylate cyclase (GGDEF)-like protein/PAS domain S-box-containing protein
MVSMGDIVHSVQSGSWYQLLFEANPVPMLICDTASHQFLDANASAVRHYGFARDALLNMTPRDLLPPGEETSLPPELEAMRESPSLHVGRRRHRRKDGSCIYVDVLRHPIPFGEKQAVLLILHDMSACSDAEKMLRQTQENLHRVQEIAHVGTWAWDVEKDLHDSTTPESVRIFGLDANEVPISTERLFLRIHPEDREGVMNARARALADPNVRFDVGFRIVHLDGNVRHVHSIGEVEFDDQGRAVRMVGTVQDITEQKRGEDEIRRLAYYDDVTGLPNRILIRQKIGEALSAAAGSSTAVALLIIDLVRFRDVNYTLGHINGNDLLKAAGERISHFMHEPDVVARIGTRYVALLHNANAHTATQRAHEILSALEVPFPIVGITYELSAHIGISLAPGHGMDIDTLLRKADVAIWQAKQAGQNLAIYQAAHDPYNPQRLALIGEFRKAIQAGELQLYCQPKADLRTGEIAGAEALVRWQHPKYGLIAPDQFIPLVESTDLIHLLTQFMLESAVSQCHSWRQRGAHVPLAVNLSTRNLRERDLDDYLNQLLLTWGADAQWLGLEVTESSLMEDPAACIEELTRLSRMGFRLYVDDFGTGYSSLSYLAKMPINVIKIDHGFTMNMTKDRGAATIVKSTIDLAHNLGMSVVAEGTANQEIWEVLAGLGCDEAQGHFISPPIPGKDFMDWVSTSKYSLPSGARQSNSG